MQKNTTPCYYGDYLQLDKILTSQDTQSAKYGAEAHDETLFIIVHQVYELWFKQILHELEAVLQVFAGEAVKDDGHQYQETHDRHANHERPAGPPTRPAATPTTSRTARCAAGRSGCGCRPGTTANCWAWTPTVTIDPGFA